jgi:hypothetical protein
LLVGILKSIFGSKRLKKKQMEILEKWKKWNSNLFHFFT